VGHGSSTTHKYVCDIDLAGWCIQGCGSLTTWSEVWHLGFYNVMLEIQAIKNIFLIPTTPPLKNVASLSTHENNNNNNTRISLTNKNQLISIVFQSS